MNFGDKPTRRVNFYGTEHAIDYERGRAGFEAQEEFAPGQFHVATGLPRADACGIFVVILPSHPQVATWMETTVNSGCDCRIIVDASVDFWWRGVDQPADATPESLMALDVLERCMRLADVVTVPSPSFMSVGELNPNIAVVPNVSDDESGVASLRGWMEAIVIAARTTRNTSPNPLIRTDT